MSQTTAKQPIDVSSIPLVGCYLIGLIATTIAIGVVLLLNLFTPLDAIRVHLLDGESHLNGSAVVSRFLPRLLILLSCVFVIFTWVMNRMLAPIAAYLREIKRGKAPGPDARRRAALRLLNLPFLFAPVNIALWIFIPAVIFCISYLFRWVDHRTAAILAVRASMIGLIASGIASHRIEQFSRRHFIPFLL